MPGLVAETERDIRIRKGQDPRVNLSLLLQALCFGGWLNTEPFIVPGLYEKYANSTPRPVDEWTLSLAMGDNLAAEMEEHYKTFITEKDFMEVAAAGLNYVRIPIGYWALEVEEGEPFLAKVSWTYFLKAIEWARKYGIRINLDLRAFLLSELDLFPLRRRWLTELDRFDRVS
jgi:aryl-phospho-beta-D-glucosidase BglC (GH1 family)